MAGNVENFPVALQPLIQKGYLERAFSDALWGTLVYRSIAERESFSNNIGETITKTRFGWLNPATTPLVAGSNTNFDNGMSATTWGVEQYVLSLNMYGNTMDLNTVTEKLALADQFYHNAIALGKNAAQTMDDLARDTLFTAYMSGNTRVVTTLGSPGTAVAVDDISGFQYVYLDSGYTSGTTTPTGTFTAISNTNFLVVTIGSNAYHIGTAAADVSNVSTSPWGISGTLTTTAANITVADGTAGNSVTAASAGTIVRPSGRGNTSLIQGSDTLTMQVLLDAVAVLRSNSVPDIDGMYHCFLDPVSARQLFADPDFRQLFQGATSSNQVFRRGMYNEMLGLRFFPTTEVKLQTHPSITGAKVRRPIICGYGALIEGDFAGMTNHDIVPSNADITMVDDVAFVNRHQMDRLQQIIAQSWYWIGGFTVPSDATTNSTIIPTASNARFKRSVVVEHVG